MTSIFDKVRKEKQKGMDEKEIETSDEMMPQEVSQERSPIFSSEKKQPQKKEIPQKKTEQGNFPFESDEDLDREIERNVARGLTRMGETVVGLPGDIESFVRSMLPEDQHSERFLPTSKEAQETTEKLGQGYLTPKNDSEKATDEILKDVASYMVPGSGQASFVRNLGIPLAGYMAKEGIKHLGKGSEGQQTWGKLGTMFFLDVLNNRRTMGMGGAKNFLEHLRRDSEALVPQGATTHIRGLERALDTAIHNLEQGGPAASKTPALESMRHFRSVVQNDRIPVRELIQGRKAINENVFSKGGFDYFKQNPQVQEKAVSNLNHVKKMVISGLDHYSQSNPQFGILNRAYNEGYAAFSSSNYFTNFMKKNFGDKISNGTVKALFGLAPVAGAAGMKYAPFATALGAAAIPIYQAVKLGHRIANSSTLRNYYNNIVRHAMQGNVAAAATNVKKLEKTFEDEEKAKKKKIEMLKHQAKQTGKIRSKSSRQKTQ